MLNTVASVLALVAVVANATPVHERQVTSTPILAVTPAQWAALNSSVGGRLYRGYPVARPCFPVAATGVAGTYNLLTCSDVQNRYTNDSFIADNFGAYQNSNWGTCQKSGAECLLDRNAPQNPLATAQTCQQGSVSPYYVDVRRYQDVQAIFAFAKKYSVPLAIKNSGHDYKGRSSAPNSLGVWVHNLQGISRNKAFVPAGCPASTKYDGVTVGGGVGFLGIYQFAEANGITILGGSSETVVAAGGWIGGAGHGALSNQLGLGVDRALQFKVVTAAGDYLTASPCQNTDLFYAVRGGGGGTYGVVMEMTTQAAPKVTLQVAYVKFASADLDVSRRFLEVLIANAQKWANEGWGGYIEPGAITTQTGGFVLMTPLLDNAAASASMKPVHDFVYSLPNAPINYEVTQKESFFQAYNQYLVPNEELVNIGVATGSRLIPKNNFNAGAPATALLNAILQGMQTVGTNVASNGLVYGGAPTQILMTTPYNFKGYRDSPVTPAWRTAIWHVLFAPTFNYDATPAQISTIFQRATTAAQYLRDITPGSGAYQNEADVYEPSHEVSFWGQANYNRLVTLKKKFDPNNILACWHCIGWKASDARYSCYPE